MDPSVTTRDWGCNVEFPNEVEADVSDGFERGFPNEQEIDANDGFDSGFPDEPEPDRD